MRPLIQYDLDDPPAAHPDPQPTGPQPNPHRPLAKKRKRNHHSHSSAQKTPFQHWDDPGSSTVGVAYDEQEASVTATMSYVGEENGDEDIAAEGEVEDEEESRPLTHDEIWDDSALIDAWNSAEAEYNAYHGTSKAWKTEPVKKSPLWYNKPYTAPGPSKPTSRSKHGVPQVLAQEDGEPERDTAPLDFDTYVPTHDPSLAIPSDNGSTTPALQVPPSTMMVSRDEAFNNALSAMYWSGYWTAVYHCQSQTSRENNNGLAEATEEDEIEADDGEDLVPAQR